MVRKGRSLAQLATLTRYAGRLGAGRRPAAQSLTVWQVLLRQAGRRRATPARAFGHRDLWHSFASHQAVFWGALAITLAAAAASFVLQRPLAEVETRVVVAAGGEDRVAARQTIEVAGRALATSELRLAALDAAGWRHVFPDLAAADPAAPAEAMRRLSEALSVAPAGDGAALLIDMRHGDADVAADYGRALAEVLVARLAQGAKSVPAARPAPMIAGMAGPRDALLGTRARVAADLASVDRRAAVLSDGLTDTAHDMVSALRATAAESRPPAADVLDQGRVLMAELQLKRLQLASKYQDDFPAVTALDGEIERLRGFLAGEQRRDVMPRSPASPVLETLAQERRRLAAELDEENQKRVALRVQLATLDAEITAAAPVAAAPAAAGPAAPRLVAGGSIALPVPDPRLLSVPAILLVGLLGALLLQWAMLRSRTVIATVAEAELVLGLPVLRCLDVDGHPVPILTSRPGVMSGPGRRAVSVGAGRRSG